MLHCRCDNEMPFLRASVFWACREFDHILPLPPLIWLVCYNAGLMKFPWCSAANSLRLFLIER